VNVVTCLPPSLVSRVRQACALTCTLHAAPSWNEALRLAHERDADVLVFEPTDAVTASDFASLVAAAPHVVLVGYASVSSAAVRATLALGQHESSRMIIRGIDDDPARLRHALAQAMESSLAARIFDAISSDVARIPAPLTAALDRMLRHPRRFLGVEDLAQSASLNRRALDRWLARAGLSSARTLLACARAAGAWRALARRGVTLAAAAESLGVSERLLARDIRRATGSGARRLAKHTSPRDLVGLLAGTMHPSPHSAPRRRSSHAPGERIDSGAGAGSTLWQSRFLEVREGGANRAMRSAPPDPDCPHEPVRRR
jgi:AraC-like DNA-binding protein